MNNQDYRNENDNSSIIYTELNNYKFLFMGDAGVEVEEDLIEKYNLQDIDVLKVGHPNDIVLENLEESKIYRTDIDGSITFKIKRNELEIETCAP